MKKRYFIIVIVLLIIFLGFLTSYIDSARVRNSVEPKFTIKIVSKDGSKVTYWGLGYKVVRYVSVSPNEPYKNNRGVKYGNWFMKYILDDEEKKDNNFIATEVENVSYQISNISSTGATIIIKDTNKPSYYYGNWYKIEKNINGNWQELETLEEGYIFTQIAYSPDENNQVKFVMTWDDIYGKLDNGSYRILKKANNKYISIEFTIATSFDSKLAVVKSQTMNTNQFNEYIKRDDRTIYLYSEIEEIYYYKDSNTKITLKEHIANSYQTLNDSINEITNLLTLVDMYDDGGTSIYKSETQDVTIVICKKLFGNNNIYLGDYSLKYDIDILCE